MLSGQLLASGPLEGRAHLRSVRDKQRTVPLPPRPISQQVIRFKRLLREVEINKNRTGSVSAAERL